MTPLEIIEVVHQIINTGLSGVLLIILWQLWRAYQDLVNDLRKLREHFDELKADRDGDTKDLHLPL